MFPALVSTSPEKAYQSIFLHPLTWRLIAIFFGTVAISIIALGYLYNMVL